MGTMKVWKIALIAVIALAVIISLYIHAVYNVKLENVQVNDLQDVSLKGFVVGGDISVHNGGLLPVGVDKIDYQIILEDSGKELANGAVKGTLIMPQKTANFSFSNSINWVPTAEIAVNMVTGGNTYVKISGEVTVIDWSFLVIKLPFEKTVDLKPYITQFAKQKVREIVQNIPATVGEAANQVVSWIQQI